MKYEPSPVEQLAFKSDPDKAKQLAIKLGLEWCSKYEKPYTTESAEYLDHILYRAIWIMNHVVAKNYSSVQSFLADNGYDA